MGEVPSGYDGKILSQQIDNNINVQKKFQMGAYSTRLVVFDPFNCVYEVINQSADDTKDGAKLAGKDLPKFNSKFKSDFTRTTYMLTDKGTLPTGSILNSKYKAAEQNFETQQILNQSIRRYNQIFSAVQTITIPGDFSLHAGDVIFVDSPELNPQKDDKINREWWSIYYIRPMSLHLQKETYTKLNLVRDSFGRER